MSFKDEPASEPPHISVKLLFPNRDPRQLRYRAVEPSSGSNVIPKRDRPGLARLGTAAHFCEVVVLTPTLPWPLNPQTNNRNPKPQTPFEEVVVAPLNNRAWFGARGLYECCGTTVPSDFVPGRRCRVPVVYRERAI